MTDSAVHRVGWAGYVRSDLVQRLVAMWDQLADAENSPRGVVEDAGPIWMNLERCIEQLREALESISQPENRRSSDAPELSYLGHLRELRRRHGPPT